MIINERENANSENMFVVEIFAIISLISFGISVYRIGKRTKKIDHEEIEIRKKKIERIIKIPFMLLSDLGFDFFIGFYDLKKSEKILLWGSLILFFVSVFILLGVFRIESILGF